MSFVVNEGRGFIDTLKWNKDVIQMVIQSNMSSKSIVEVWENTVDTFMKFNVPISRNPLEAIVPESVLPALVTELNTVVGSSNATCIEGG